MTPQFDEYLKALHQAADIIEIRAIQPDRAGPAPRSKWHTAEEWLAGADHDWIEGMNRDGWNIYAGVLPRNAPGARGNANVFPGAVVWADMDHVTPAEAGERLAASVMPTPSIAVNSGHGVQCYWLLTERREPGELRALVGDMAALLQSDPAVKNEERVLRIPGFVNHKPPVADAELLECHADLRYDFEALRALAPAAKTKTSPAPSIPLAAIPDRDGTVERARRYLATVPGSGPGGRTNTAFRVAAVLVKDYALDQATALDLLTRWDAAANMPPIQGDDQYGPDELGRILVNAGRYGKHQTGALLASPAADDGFDVGAFIAGGKVVSAEAKPPKLRDLPSFDPIIQKLFSTPGFCANYMSYCREYANKYQPILAMGGLLALGATLVARRIASATGTMSNIYILPIAKSTAGKDFPRKVNTLVLDKSGMTNYYAETVKSSAALTSLLYIHPVLMIQPDEFGKKMQMARMSNNMSVSLGFELNTLYLELYTSSGGMYALPRIAEDIRDLKKARMRGECVSMPALTIDKPHLIIYGATTPETFYEKITTDSIADGLLGRMLILDVDGYNPKRRYIPNIPPPPEPLIEEARWWSSFNADTGWTDSFAIQPVKLPLTDDAIRIAKDFIDIEYEEMKALGDNPLAPLWGRTGQIADKIALIFTALRDKDNLVIDGEAMNFGYNLATIALKRTIVTIGENVAESAFDEMRLRMLKIIRNNGGRIEHWLLLKRFKRDTVDFHRVIGVLLETGVIKEDSEATATRPAKWYTLIGDN